MAELKAEVAELKARLAKDSTNSSLPPSAMHPHAKPSKQSIRKAKRRGGQPGHPKHERALRHAVIWRKLSFGTQSAGGSRFVERMLTVIETTRRRGTNAFEWLTEAVQAKLNCQAGPKLLAGV